MTALTLAIPSKGRLMEAAAERLAKAGLAIERLGAERGYRGRLTGLAGVDVLFQSASEIAQNLKEGKIDLGITGADLLHEKIASDDPSTEVLLPLGFGPADVVVAVPECWLDVAAMALIKACRHQILQSHPPLFRRQGRDWLSHRRKPGSNRRGARRGDRRGDRRYHHDRRHPCRQPSQNTG
jgi:ATP phosphoribosyltransferase